MNRFRYLLISLAVFLLISRRCSAGDTQAVVNAPVVDLRSIPSVPASGLTDHYEETQLLLGESVEVVSSSGMWIQVRAVEQPAFRYAHKWEGYPGWVLKSTLAMGQTGRFTHRVNVAWLPLLSNPTGFARMQLPLGAQVRVIGHKKDYSEVDLPGQPTGWVLSSGLIPNDLPPPAELRNKILQTARLLLETPYMWGGRSPKDTTGIIPLTGIDCSGLVHLAYQMNGVIIPRDSAEQYLKAQKIKRHDLKTGDLIFSAPPKDPTHITHVMLYAGNDQVLEAPNTGLAVRQISFKEKTGRDFKTVESGDHLPNHVIYFGRLLND